MLQGGLILRERLPETMRYGFQVAFLLCRRLGCTHLNNADILA
ncbi:hypothetical protein EIKCOROL_00034 [Eikenella corrodens ATCC 23834]|uniref:Uncharacterized protein n=1 Tax=Eikenella corrodens ATCC 23834 TaxID=546274 RepID=C0DRR8_EIKCO|nr:hypothetical protein EIKCOROL_00034 [Eikenella corrodens ATCC 23834]